MTEPPHAEATRSMAMPAIKLDPLQACIAETGFVLIRRRYFPSAGRLRCRSKGTRSEERGTMPARRAIPRRPGSGKIGSPKRGELERK